MGVLVLRAVLFGIYIRAPEVWELPHELRSELLVVKASSSFKRALEELQLILWTARVY